MTGPKQGRRIIHFTSSLSRSGGGIPPVIWSLAQNTQALGSESMVTGLKDEFFETDCRSRSVQVIAGKVRGPRAVGYSPELGRLMGSQIRSTDVVHSHGLWMYPGALAFQLSQRTGCKRVVSPHGMLEPWALQNSRWKKRTAGWLFEKRNLRTADCLHALCHAEADNFRNYGLPNPIAVIPNGVDLKKSRPSREKQTCVHEHPEMKGRQLLLFLSRIHPKKGLTHLLRAWASLRLQDRNWSLIVAGPDESSHESELRELASSLGISRHTLFTGPVYGEEKDRLLCAADAFVLPSLSEGFSMAVLEAAAAGLPVLLTKECNFPELAAAGAAIETPAGAPGVAAGLARFTELSEAQRNSMGTRGFELVRDSYAWPAIAKEMLRVYDWLAETGPQPACIRLD